jgi:hypothetical protein
MSVRIEHGRNGYRSALPVGGEQCLCPFRRGGFCRVPRTALERAATTECA